MKMIKDSVQAETVGLGYVMAALISAQPTNVEELRFFLEKIKEDMAARDMGFEGESAAFSVASAMLRGVDVFERDQ